MKMKFRAHDTFFIRKGWISKGMRHVYNNPDVLNEENYKATKSVIENRIRAFFIFFTARTKHHDPA